MLKKRDTYSCQQTPVGRCRRRHTQHPHQEREPCNDAISCKACAALIAAALPPWLVRAGPATTLSPLGKPQAFDYAWLKGQARALANGVYQPPVSHIPDAVKALDWGSVSGHTLPRRPRALGQGRLALPGEVLSSGPILQEPSTDV